ncbi:MAG TPA: hypothetical protein VFK10_08010 [Burkholderiaceae bacterium]|nr:hypothetical protein [Burkholderiaceae bacterium]
MPESGEFALTLPARQATAAHAQQFADAQARVPLEARAVQARARIERRSLAVEVDGLPAAMHGRTLRFFAEMTGVIDHAAAIAQRWDAGRWLAQVPLSSQRSESPIQMHAVLVPEGQARGIRVRLTITGSWSTAALAAVSAARRVVMLAPHNAREPSSMASTKE